MSKFQHGNLKLFFGDATTAIDPVLLAGLAGTAVQELPGVQAVTQALGARVLVLPHQVHTANAIVLRTARDVQVSLACAHDDARDADIVMTNLPGIALGVLTADCLPIVLYDETVQAFAAVHAGWRGTHQEVVMRAVELLRETFGAEPGRLRVWCGPCGHVEAYEVRDDFRAELLASPAARYADQVLVRREVKFPAYILRQAPGLRSCKSTLRQAQGERDLGHTFCRSMQAPAGRQDERARWHYDLLKHNVLQLQDAGVPPANIDTSQSVCTITDTRYCSYRRQRQLALRQITACCLT